MKSDMLLQSIWISITSARVGNAGKKSPFWLFSPAVDVNIEAGDSFAFHYSELTFALLIWGVVGEWAWCEQGRCKPVFGSLQISKCSSGTVSTHIFALFIAHRLSFDLFTGQIQRAACLCPPLFRACIICFTGFMLFVRISCVSFPLRRRLLQRYV